VVRGSMMLTALDPLSVTRIFLFIVILLVGFVFMSKIVFCGGSCSGIAVYTRSVYRYRYNPDFRNGFIGFRLHE